MSRIVYNNIVSGNLVDATSVVLADITSTYGVKRDDLGTVVVTAGTVMTKIGTGSYEYHFTDPAYDLIYTYCVKALNSGIYSYDSETLEGPSFQDLSYLTLAELENYFDSRINSTVYTSATTAEKQKAAIYATKLIEQLNFRGKRVSTSQIFQFPRGSDTTIPQDIKEACAEIVLAVLDGVDLELEYENLSMVAHGYANIRATYNRERAAEHIIAGIPSILAWRKLKPYLRQSKAILLSRV